jgi:hypothetical protein
MIKNPTFLYLNNMHCAKQSSRDVMGKPLSQLVGNTVKVTSDKTY